MFMRWEPLHLFHCLEEAEAELFWKADWLCSSVILRFAFNGEFMKDKDHYMFLDATRNYHLVLTMDKQIAYTKELRG